MSHLSGKLYKDLMTKPAPLNHGYQTRQTVSGGFVIG
jgi:hypothetical protein